MSTREERLEALLRRALALIGDDDHDIRTEAKLISDIEAELGIT